MDTEIVYFPVKKKFDVQPFSFRLDGKKRPAPHNHDCIHCRTNFHIAELAHASHHVLIDFFHNDILVEKMVVGMNPYAAMVLVFMLEWTFTDRAFP